MNVPDEREPGVAAMHQDWKVCVGSAPEHSAEPARVAAFEIPQTLSYSCSEVSGHYEEEVGPQDQVQDCYEGQAQDLRQANARVVVLPAARCHLHTVEMPDCPYTLVQGLVL